MGLVSVWLCFFQFGSVFFGSVWFFGFRLMEPDRTEPVSFLNILIGFFYGSVFLVIFFLVFSV